MSTYTVFLAKDTLPKRPELKPGDYQTRTEFRQAAIDQGRKWIEPLFERFLQELKKRKLTEKIENIRYAYITGTVVLDTTEDIAQEIATLVSVKNVVQDEQGQIGLTAPAP